MRARRWWLVVLVLWCVACAPTHLSSPGAPSSGRADETLRFRIADGSTQNYFLRRGPVAAHVLVTSGASPRVIVAFPAGNSGVGVWFERPGAPVDLALRGELSPIERQDGMRGVRFVVRTPSKELKSSQELLGSLHFITDFARGYSKDIPPELAHRIDHGAPGEGSITLRRTTLDGKRMELEIKALGGAVVDTDGATFHVTGAASAVDVEMTALTDYTPLTPIPSSMVLRPTATADAQSLEALAFLSYREKLLAGSWRFLTYFGRDTLLSLRLLSAVAQPDLLEAGLSAVIERIDSDGWVAHEEDLGEYAIVHRRHPEPRFSDPPGTLAPYYYHRMIDEQFMLAPLLAEYALATADGQARARAFLARRTTDGARYDAVVAKNFALALREARPFARDPRATNLVSARAKVPEGNWRDSADCADTEGYLCNFGLGGGRIPFDVNAALVPAALEAIDRLYDAKVFTRPDGAADLKSLEQAWSRAADLFRVEIPAASARPRLEAYAREQGLAAPPKDAAAPSSVSFHALALSPSGVAVPVMNTDEGFVLLFRDPSPAYLEEVAALLTRPFPAGLMTPVGVVVGNPAYVEDREIRERFARNRYHGTVVWSWQHALLASGLDRQLRRTDLPPRTRDALTATQGALWDVIRNNAAHKRSELWSFSLSGDRFVSAPFRADVAANASPEELHDLAEANAIQLWSTVYLALAPHGASK